VAHANARLTPLGRLTLCERIAAGRPVAHVADEMGISRPTAYRWWKRFCSDGDAGLVDRSSRPHRSPAKTKRKVEKRIEGLRRKRKLGPARIGAVLGVPPSTVHRVLVRRGLNRLAWMDRPTGRVIRRMTADRPGELVHVDIKKLGRIPAGGGWKVHGRGKDGHNGYSRVGYAFIHSAIDAYSRLAYSEILANEQGSTAAAFWERAAAFFLQHGIIVERVLTDNGSCYRSKVFDDALDTITHTFTRPYRPQTNGKVERFNRTLLDEWAYVRTYRSDSQRNQAFSKWLHLYNHHRTHTALDGTSPIDRVNNVIGQYS
jgi:transposase InsO family protein